MMLSKMNAVLLAAILLSAALVSMAGSSSATPLPQVSMSTVHVTSPTILKGSIANVQLDSEGNPEWIESGFWLLRLRPSASDSSLPSANLVSRISMVGVDGTSMHGHLITNFALARASTEGNTTHVFEGTATITMRDGPVSGVPLTIKILNNAAIAMWIGPDRIDSHFGTDPVYGTLTESSSAAMAEIRAAVAMNDRPANVTGTALESRTINYYGNATGYIVHPEDGAYLPAVIMFHEWWGLNQHIKDAANKLDNEGYVVLAVDLYNGEVATESSRAGQLAGSVSDNPAEAIGNLNAAVQHVSSLQNVNGSRIASLGWCFGGGQSMQLALNTDQPLAATVIYYGNLVTDQAELAEITWPVLGVFGSIDQSIPVDTVNQFDAALDANGVTNEIYIYEGVGHAFANPSGDNYAPEETADAWERTLAFMSRYV
jgi:carboxymethylenebutenolidase